MLPYDSVEVREYLDPEGRSPFGEWFLELNAAAAAKVTVAVTRLRQGNFSNMKSIGSGIHEYKINFGPGYRIYFGKDGSRIVILLAGGTKKRQQRDIENAIVYWQDYKARKALERWR